MYEISMLCKKFSLNFVVVSFANIISKISQIFETGYTYPIAVSYVWDVLLVIG